MIHILILILYIYLNPLPFRVSCKKCAAGVKQIDDTISDGGNIYQHTIKRCDKTLFLKREWFRIPLDNVGIICERV